MAGRERKRMENESEEWAEVERELERARKRSSWVPCRERMPKPEDFEPWERVLVLGRPHWRQAGKEAPMLAYLDAGRWRKDGGDLVGAVTRWMRIPRA
jgi:hypothetical protein